MKRCVKENLAIIEIKIESIPFSYLLCHSLIPVDYSWLYKIKQLKKTSDNRRIQLAQGPWTSIELTNKNVPVLLMVDVDLTVPSVGMTIPEHLRLFYTNRTTFFPLYAHVNPFEGSTAQHTFPISFNEEKRWTTAFMTVI